METLDTEAAAIDAVGISKTYEDGAGLKSLDLRVPEGSVVGIIGPSGAGKTTAVRMFTGLLSRDHGELAVLGRDPDRFDTGYRSRIGYLPQDTLLYPTLSVQENIDFVAATYGLRGRARARARERVLSFVELDDVQERRLSALSGGMRRRAGLAAALVHSPQLVVLDEPTAGQDPILRRTLWTGLGDLSREGTTMVVTTQHVAEAAYCDLVALLSEGELIALGGPDELRRDAFGGDLIDVDFESTPGWPDIQKMAGAIEASTTTALGPQSVRYTVEDASVAIPVLADAAEAAAVTVAGTDRHIPDLDEVFVRLVDRHREDRS